MTDEINLHTSFRVRAETPVKAQAWEAKPGDWITTLKIASEVSVYLGDFYGPEESVVAACDNLIAALDEARSGAVARIEARDAEAVPA